MTFPSAALAYSPIPDLTAPSRQILVTVASTPASVVLAVDDMIHGAKAANSGTGQVFSLAIPIRPQNRVSVNNSLLAFRLYCAAVIEPGTKKFQTSFQKKL